MKQAPKHIDAEDLVLAQHPPRPVTSHEQPLPAPALQQDGTSGKVRAWLAGTAWILGSIGIAFLFIASNTFNDPAAAFAAWVLLFTNIAIAAAVSLSFVKFLQILRIPLKTSN